jgi:hypothetical protein
MIHMWNEETVKAVIQQVCREELGREVLDLNVEERDYLFWVKIGGYHTRVERLHLDDYLHDNEEGKAKIVESLLNCKRK